MRHKDEEQTLELLAAKEALKEALTLVDQMMSSQK